MKRFRTIYVCDNCGFENENPHLFREVFGNVRIAESDMIIGNNIWDKKAIPDTVKNAIKQKMMPLCHNSTDTVITGMTFCLKCYIKKALNTKNLDANLQTQEREILTSILSELQKNTIIGTNKKTQDKKQNIEISNIKNADEFNPDIDIQTNNEI